jgi:hypothetical protein
MAVRIVITPGDSMWWLLRPEFLAYVDAVTLDAADYKRAKSERSDSGYHAAVWRRLSVLETSGLVVLEPVVVDWRAVNLRAQRAIQAILADPGLTKILVTDLISAYKYWLEFNQQRLEILPVLDDYAECVREHIPIWTKDLGLLLSRGERAFQSEPKILKQTAGSIMARVTSLWEINRRCRGIAFASLGQFRPFLKYLDYRPGAIPGSGPVSRRRFINLPVEPDLGFLSCRLSKRAFWERLEAIRAGFGEVRSAVDSLLGAGDEMLEAARTGRPGPKALTRYLGLERKIDSLASRMRSRSPYLKDVFYGVSLVPNTELIGVLSGGAGIVGEPAAGHYAIQESLLDLSRFEAIPRAKVWQREGAARTYSFWRGEN